MIWDAPEDGRRSRAPSDVVHVERLRAWGHHGVLAAERRDGQEFLVDVALSLDARPAARRDDLSLTVDYGTLAEDLAADVGRDPVALLETLADRLAVRCLVAGPQVAAVQVRVSKEGAPVTVAVASLGVTVRRSRLRAAVGLGSNVGDRARHLADGLGVLDRTPGVDVLAVSTVVESTPVGGPPQDDHLNCVATCEVASARTLLAAAQEAERASGRERVVRWGPRTLDVDLLAVGDEVWREPDLLLPHPRSTERAFVLLPWAELEPHRELLGRSVAQRAAGLDGEGVAPRPDVDVRPPTRPWVRRA